MFEKYLQDACFAENPQVLDDDMPDFFEHWLSTLDGEDYMNYGNKALEEAEQRLVNSDLKNAQI